VGGPEDRRAHGCERDGGRHREEKDDRHADAHA
jgi:hypothetical protein